MWNFDAGCGHTMKEVQDPRPFLFFCNGKDCQKRRTPELDREIKRCKKSYQVIRTNCMDHCKEAPNLVVDNRHYTRVSVKDLLKIVNKKAVK